MKKSCLRCGNCCTRFGVLLTPFDIRRIALATGMGPEEFVDAIPEPKARERTEPAIIVRGKRALLALRRDGADVCCFYSGRGCLIYRERPMLCRTYPFTNKGPRLAGTKSRACGKCWEPEGKEKAQYMRDCRQYKREVAAFRRMAAKWNLNRPAKGRTHCSFVEFALRKAPLTRP